MDLKTTIQNIVDIQQQTLEYVYGLEKQIETLERELKARVEQVEDLQSSYKTLQKENKMLKSKLEQTVDEYDEDYQTFHRDDFDENFRKIFWDFLDGNF